MVRYYKETLEGRGYGLIGRVLLNMPEPQVQLCGLPKLSIVAPLTCILDTPEVEAGR